MCDDSWDYYDAAVVCRQLGFGTLGQPQKLGSVLTKHNICILKVKTSTPTIPFFSTGAFSQGGSFYGQGSGPVHLDDVECEGIEDALINCSRRRFGFVGSNCRTHSEDASVVCPTCKLLKSLQLVLVDVY